MSNSFYVVLPSNTNIEGNRTNSFRVRLARKLQFNSDWYVGLGVLVYPHSWPSMGTTAAQHVRVVWRTGESVQITVPSSSFTSPQELADSLHKLLYDGSDALAKRVRTAQMSLLGVAQRAREKARAEHSRLVAEREPQAAAAPAIDELGTLEDANAALSRQQRAAEQTGVPSIVSPAAAEQVAEAAATTVLPPPIPGEDVLYNRFFNEELNTLDDEDRRIYDGTKEQSLEAWVHAYRKVNFTCQFRFDPTKNRFSLYIDNGFVKQVELSEQLAYILGFEQQTITKTTQAKFMPDMRGGVSSFHVYAPGLIEPMMIGDVCAPVLRIVTIRGQQDEIVEEQFLSVQYHKLLTKEIAEIFIEIRADSGTLMPFQYGTCCLTLHFKKAAYF
jgi:hypothetical protein